MQMPINVWEPVVQSAENAPSPPPAGTRRIAACLLLACSFVGCLSATVPEANEAQRGAPLSHDEASRLIDSLANHNEEPLLVPVHSSIASLSENPLFADDYDWDEDDRVWRVIREFKKYNGEELWNCLLEHLDDERYVVAYALDDEAYIQTIGNLCRCLARDYLDVAYMKHLPSSMDGNTPAMRLFSPEGVGLWCRDHAGIPLYRQQAELCEAAIKKMQTMPRVPGADKAKFTADVRRQIGALLRTRDPNVVKRRLLPGDGGKDFYNAAVAEEIKDKYLAGRNAGTQDAK
jgi:hypothetical protein